ncbi:hypothetical protein KSD_77300 [Ktedonobacter sp. SOSP1-85]|uniref:DNA double-strand break repair nuclease NurA n=1 Tax=Ktedonobacter sp. SOSP1-85 TaxID=2778367 RepID=UPI001915672B|nr:DNA double-strand break repair nuclease NurA [Ktedonobacter sp. SOSP1-85]GHO79959.1 hypothetical protein KSD_77300 [Ktedonobacter sp. SOSP1-85]
MASFIDLIAESIHLRRDEFLTGFTEKPHGDIEQRLAAGIQAHWHPLSPEVVGDALHQKPQAGAVDGSRAIRALSIGADWIVAQALLLGPDGLRLSVADTLLLRGEIELPALNRCASLLMRSLELDLALKFVREGLGNVLLLDGSLYADLPYLLYNLAIGGYEDLPSKVLGQYLDLFDLCQQRGVLLLGIAKRTRSTILGHALLAERQPAIAANLQQGDLDQTPEATMQAVSAENGSSNGNQHHPDLLRRDLPRLPSDGELLYRWAVGSGITDPVLLGSTSFGHTSAQKVAALAAQLRQAKSAQGGQEQLSPLHERLLVAPAIGTFYVRLAPGEDVLRVDTLAPTFGRDDLHLLEFDHTLASYITALPVVSYLLGEYGGLSVYNAALYVVDREVRLHSATVDQVYLPVLRRQLGYPIQYDRSTRRFIG